MSDDTTEGIQHFSAPFQDPRMPEPAGGSRRFTRGARVAVVVTCFNLGEYLYEALDSIARQTLPELDLFIVDDGSTDAYTLAYLKFLVERGYAVLQQTNAGLADARNTGIRAVAGEYLCCFDADDRMHPEWLARASQVLDSDPGLGFVSCYYSTFDKEDAVYRYDHTRLPEMLVENQTVVVSLFRRAAWETVSGYCPQFHGMEDWDFWIGILEAGYRATVIPEVLFHYRVRTGSMYSSVREPEVYTANMALLLERHRRAFEEHWAQVVLLRTRQFAELLGLRRAEAAGFELRLSRQDLVLDQLRQAVEQQRSAIALHNRQAAAASTRFHHLSARFEEVSQVLASQRPGPVGRAVRNLVLVLSHAAGPRHWKNLALAFQLARDPEKQALWNRMFDPSAYAAANPDVMVAGVSLWLHYILSGYQEGRTASRAFDTEAYLRARPDVAAAGVNPLLHYVLFGSRQR